MFSGTATEATSESLVSKGQGLLAAAARAAGLLRSPPAGAVHTLVVQTPGGQQRSFRCGAGRAGGGRAHGRMGVRL